mmetsp:Transcript_5134/g.7658  ORF Transcript_5134/g.7658 Transcript_5134/m.7658 type:complete len:450 (-) Transcript_5134:142-1491(-)
MSFFYFFILGFSLIAMSKEIDSLPCMYQNLFKVRTVTAFIRFEDSDFQITENATNNDDKKESAFRQKLKECFHLLKSAQKGFADEGYEVQTLRIATNSFGEWACDASSAGSSSSDMVLKNRLAMLDQCLDDYDVNFCALGPARNVQEIGLCPAIVEASPRFSCSANIDACDVQSATAAANAILKISTLGEGDPQSSLAGGIGNFRFCAAASCCVPFIPFFPAAKCDSNASGISFALGLENGSLAREILSKCNGLEDLKHVLKQEFTNALSPLERISKEVASKSSFPVKYLGIDSSFNPSLEDEGSIAAAIEQLKEVPCFGGVGTLAAAAAITTTIQSLPIKLIGYCGLMLPVLEDQRLSELASETPSKLKISQLLNISSVCGVGIDTVPIPGKCSADSISSLILDMSGLAARWDKSLSCRVFPLPGEDTGSFTKFDSPYLCNSRVFDVS